MSLSDAPGFTTDMLPNEELESGTSILLTGGDTDTLKRVFASLVAAEDDEYSVVLATNSGGRAFRQTLDSVKRGAGQNAAILTCEGPARGDDVTVIDELSDLTTLGMEFSNLISQVNQTSDGFRSGIFLCSTLVGEVEDTRSVYRFLNTTFLTDLRRNDGLGVCAVDTSASLDTDIDSMLTGLETSMSARIDIESSDGDDVELTLSGFGPTEKTVTARL
ncbi:DUF7504 family protein [Halovenus salina]|uniref:DUF7504 family protein n=1 Tax=Halovenus salina TaxID=1510225 RepID=UPI002260A79F|nr:hypothetical protein [Halovenus salina]